MPTSASRTRRRQTVAQNGNAPGPADDELAQTRAVDASCNARHAMSRGLIKHLVRAYHDTVEEVSTFEFTYDALTKPFESFRSEPEDGQTHGRLPDRLDRESERFGDWLEVAFSARRAAEEALILAILATDSTPADIAGRDLSIAYPPRAVIVGGNLYLVSKEATDDTPVGEPSAQGRAMWLTIVPMRDVENLDRQAK